MSQIPDWLITSAITIALFLFLRFNEEKIRSFLRFADNNKLKGKIEYLEEKLDKTEKDWKDSIENVKAAYEAEIKTLHLYIESLLEQIDALKAFTNFNEEKTPSLLLVCGETTFCEQDENSISRANVDYKRIIPTSIEELEEEFRRARIAEHPYQFIHISSHASPVGMLINGINVNPFRLAKMIDKTKVLVLAGCKDIRIADRLVGVADYIISLREDTATELLEEFTYLFWRNINLGIPVNQAYDQAIRLLPELKNQIDFRASK